MSSTGQSHTPKPISVVLIGLRGSGKSTLGRRVATSMSVGFVDLDARTPGLLGAASAADAINSHGLAAFRDAERAALESVLIGLTDGAESTRVVALGGGTPTAPGAAELLRAAQSRGTIRMVYLHAPPSVLRDRLSETDTETRPSLTGENMLDEIETVYLQRDAFYHELADWVVESEGYDEHDLAERIVSFIKNI